MSAGTFAGDALALWTVYGVTAGGEDTTDLVPAATAEAARAAVEAQRGQGHTVVAVMFGRQEVANG